MIWNGVPYRKGNLPALMNKVKHIVNSIKSYNPNIKVLLHTVTSQPDDGNFFSTGATFSHYESSKHCQELFNEAILDPYDTDASRTSGIHVMTSSAKFGTRSSIKMGTFNPYKFNTAYSE